jgi:hypothetical protein
MTRSDLLPHGKEEQKFHTRILRVAMAIEDSSSYWQQQPIELGVSEIAAIAFESRWFGSKSMARVKALLADFRHRYDTYPVALTVLRQWRPTSTTRQTLCHWHLQLSDPVYRSFTGEFLQVRQQQSNPIIDRDTTARWVRLHFPDWSSATVLRMATSLLTCAADAGLCKSGPGQRNLCYPTVSDEALLYWIYWLRHLQFDGTLLSNPYFKSVGLDGGFLEQRLTKLSGLQFSRMGDLHEFAWDYPDFRHWAVDCLMLMPLNLVSKQGCTSGQEAVT